ncbi:MAG: bifunctional folylpolyglutamate synthase/dihydrofolate synthase [Dehalococcoidia bacterium]|nr:bifunctional folylpolyglutamate synthase/dihydrofolate synthase [Dehalococcoidia bacterium]
MNFNEAERYVLRLVNYEQTSPAAYSAEHFNLKRMVSLMAKLGNPHIGPLTVHVAGTKGKGSCSAMSASILRTTGFKTGLYTSPHLLSICERMKIDDRNISQASFARIASLISPFVEKTNKEGMENVTTFEMLTAMAFVWFHENHVEAQVLEVGLGGRLDATNVCQPDVCIITSLSLDHTDVLGSALSAIAREKAGIIKPGVPVVSSPQQPEALAELEQVAKQKRSTLTRVEDLVSWEPLEATVKGQSFSLIKKSVKRKFWIPLLGRHQIENASTVIEAMTILSAKNKKVTQEAISEGLKSVKWPGRLQIISEKPYVVLDGAHNDYSMGCLVDSIEQYFKHKKVITIVGFSANKNIEGMAKQIKRFDGQVFVTKSTHPRAADLTQVKSFFSKQGIKVTKFDDIRSAFATASKKAKKDDLILITGSLFIVANAMGIGRPKYDALAVSPKKKTSAI